MNNKKTYYLVILDKSGSMSNCIAATQKGFNAQIDMIRAIRHKFPEQEVCVSFTQFNDQVEEVVHKNRLLMYRIWITQTIDRKGVLHFMMLLEFL